MQREIAVERKIRSHSINLRHLCLHLFIIVGLGFYAFHNNYDHAYNLDDTYGLLDNQYVRSLAHIPRYFVDPLTLTSYQSNGDYRPVLQITYAINYWISEYETWSWHLLQVMLHIIVVLSLYWLCIEMLNFSDRPPKFRALWFGPLWIGILAVLHPTSAGVVNYFWARSSLLVAAFLVPSFALYLRQRMRGEIPTAALVLYSLALFTKVEAVAGLAVFAVIEAVIYRRQSIDMRVGFFANLWEALLRSRRSGLRWFLLVSLVYFVIRWLVMPDFAEEMRHDADVTPLVYFATQLTAWWYYILKWFAPFQLVADNTAYPIYRSLLQPEVCIAAAGWIIAAAAVLKLWRHRPELAFFAISALVVISPTSSIAPLSEMVNEHRPYLPIMLASCMWITLLFDQLQGKGRDRNLALKFLAGIGLVSLAGIFSQLTLERNLVFKTSRSYTEDIVTKAPSARSYVNYGLTFLKSGDYPAAREFFKKSETLAPNWFITLINLGIVEDQLGNADAAMRYLDRAVQLEQNTTIALQYRAAAWERRQDVSRAIQDLRSALLIAPTDCVAIKKLRDTLSRASMPANELDVHLGSCVN